MYIYFPYRIHVWYAYLHLPSKSQPNVGPYSIFHGNPMGFLSFFLRSHTRPLLCGLGDQRGQHHRYGEVGRWIYHMGHLVNLSGEIREVQSMGVGEKPGKRSSILFMGPPKPTIFVDLCIPIVENPFTTMVFHRVCWGCNYLITRGSPSCTTLGFQVDGN